MNRRQVLATGVTLSMATLAGCTGVLSSLDDSEDSRKIGDTVSHEGVEFTPTDYLLANEITWENDWHSETATAERGSTFVLTRVEVVHNGDAQESFPPNDSGLDGIRNYYDGEGVDVGGWATTTIHFEVSGVELPKYSVKSIDSFYPGAKASGWVVAQVASNYDPSKLELEATWNPQMMGDDGETSYRWAYTTDAEASVDDFEDNSTTVTMG